MFLLEFRGEVNHEETRVTGGFSVLKVMILTSTVSTRVTDIPDIRTDRQTCGRAIAYSAL